jgi:hypothetical protein
VGRQGLDLFLHQHRRLPDGLRWRNWCRLHLLFLEDDGLGSKHYMCLGSHARSRCAADLSTAPLLILSEQWSCSGTLGKSGTESK